MVAAHELDGQSGFTRPRMLRLRLTAAPAGSPQPQPDGALTLRFWSSLGYLSQIYSWKRGGPPTPTPTPAPENSGIMGKCGCLALPTRGLGPLRLSGAHADPHTHPSPWLALSPAYLQSLHLASERPGSKPCVTLGKPPHLSGPPCPHPRAGHHARSP